MTAREEMRAHIAQFDDAEKLVEAILWLADRFDSVDERRASRSAEASTDASGVVSVEDHAQWRAARRLHDRAVNARVSEILASVDAGDVPGAASVQAAAVEAVAS